MVEKIRPIPDKLYPPEIEGAEDEIRDMTFSRAKELYGESLPEIVAKRIDKELNSIITNGYAVLYLISQKLVKKSKGGINWYSFIEMKNFLISKASIKNPIKIG